METLSEVIQKILKRSECLCLENCHAKITKDFFNRICKAEVHINCHHFAKQMNELKTPIAWLQRLALNESKRPIIYHGRETNSIVRTRAGK